MPRDLIVVPSWWVDLAGREREPAAPSGAGTGAVRPFRVGSRVGYYDHTGAVHNAERVLYDATVSDTLYINYSQLPANLVLKSPDGGFLGSLGSSRYPMLDRSGRRIFLVNTESTGLSEVSRDGTEIWRVEFASIITTVAIKESSLLVGLANGTLRLYDSEGNLLYVMEPQGSRVPIMLGCAVSDQAIAGVSGVDPQRLVVAQKRDGRLEPTVDLTLSSDFRREVLMGFAHQGDLLYFETDEGLGVWDLPRERLTNLPIDGRIGTVAESPDGLLGVAGSEGQVSRLKIYGASGALHYRDVVPADAVFMDWTSGNLIVGYGDTLLGLELRRQ